MTEGARQLEYVQDCPVCRFPFVTVDLTVEGSSRRLRPGGIPAISPAPGIVACRNGHRFWASVWARSGGAGVEFHLGSRLDTRAKGSSQRFAPEKLDALLGRVRRLEQELDGLEQSAASMARQRSDD